VVPAVGADPDAGLVAGGPVRGPAAGPDAGTACPAGADPDCPADVDPACAAGLVRAGEPGADAPADDADGVVTGSEGEAVATGVAAEVAVPEHPAVVAASARMSGTAASRLLPGRPSVLGCAARAGRSWSIMFPVRS
jgi:hypothetical protein